VGQPQHQKATATQISCLGQGHGQGKTGGHGRIHRIAALAQNQRTNGRSTSVLSRHQATA
jgi:hypothetical protein